MKKKLLTIMLLSAALLAGCQANTAMQQTEVDTQTSDEQKITQEDLDKLEEKITEKANKLLEGNQNDEQDEAKEQAVDEENATSEPTVIPKFTQSNIYLDESGLLKVVDYMYQYTVSDAQNILNTKLDYKDSYVDSKWGTIEVNYFTDNGYEFELGFSKYGLVNVTAKLSEANFDTVLESANKMTALSDRKVEDIMDASDKGEKLKLRFETNSWPFYSYQYELSKEDGSTVQKYVFDGSCDTDIDGTQLGMGDYKKLYADFLKKHLDTYNSALGAKYAFANINADAVEELLVSPDCSHAYGVDIYTIYGGEIQYIGSIGSNGGVRIAEGKGIILGDWFGFNSEYYYYYEMDDFAARKSQQFICEAEGAGDDATYTYYNGGYETTKEDFEEMKKKYVDDISYTEFTYDNMKALDEKAISEMQ